MLKAVNKRNWWIIPVVGGILAIAITAIQQKWLPAYDLAAFMMAIIILGISFYWVYTIDRDGLWWALIPALVMVVLIATGLVGYFTPKDASGSSPYGVITLGVGAAVIGFLLKRPVAKFVLYVVAIITLLVGILMLPVDALWKIILILADVLIIGYLAWQTARKFTSNK